MAGRCPVCGFESEDAVCPRCSTILLPGHAICPTCGKLFPGWIAACDACGSPIGPEPRGAPNEEAVRLLSSIPGITDEQVRALFDKGFRDLSDLIRLALPETAIQKGLHHAIARRLLLANLSPDSAPSLSGVPCPVCGTPGNGGADRCPVCGSATSIGHAAASVGRELQEMTEGIAALANDQDVRGMPDDVRKELFDAFADLTAENLLRDECRRQMDAWRAKGFVVAPLEDLLATDLDAFRERGVRLIRAQIRKKVDAGAYRCPLCNVVLAPEDEVCENCGAKFV